MDWLEWSFYLQSMILRELLAAACTAPLPRPRPPLPLPLPLPLPSPVALVDVFIASPRPCFPKKWSRCLMKNIMCSVSEIYHIKLFSYSRELKDITKPNVLTKPYQQIKWTLPRLTCLSYGYMYHKHNLIMKFTKQITIFFTSASTWPRCSILIATPTHINIVIFIIWLAGTWFFQDLTFYMETTFI